MIANFFGYFGEIRYLFWCAIYIVVSKRPHECIEYYVSRAPVAISACNINVSQKGGEKKLLRENLLFKACDFVIYFFI